MSLAILKDDWNPALSILRVLTHVYSLLQYDFLSFFLSHPQYFSEQLPDCPLEIEAARLYKQDREEFNKRAKEWVKLYAMCEQP